MLTVVIVGAACLVGGFVTGVLFGRKNKSKVEAVVDKVDGVVDAVKK